MSKNLLEKGAAFLKEVTARITGDNVAATAAKLTRKAISALESQIAALKAKAVDLENNVEDALEQLENAKFPTQIWIDNNSYCSAIVKAQGVVDDAKQQLENANKSIEYFTNLLDSY